MEEEKEEVSGQSDLPDDPQQRIDDWLQAWNDGTLGSLEDKQTDQ